MENSARHYKNLFQAIAPALQRREPARRWGREHFVTHSIQVQNYLKARECVIEVRLERMKGKGKKWS
jgi:hypothetical protein